MSLRSHSSLKNSKLNAAADTFYGCDLGKKGTHTVVPSSEPRREGKDLALHQKIGKKNIILYVLS